MWKTLGGNLRMRHFVEALVVLLPKRNSSTCAAPPICVNFFGMDNKNAKGIDWPTPLDRCNYDMKGHDKAKLPLHEVHTGFAPPASDPQEECQIPADRPQPLRGVRQ